MRNHFNHLVVTALLMAASAASAASSQETKPAAPAMPKLTQEELEAKFKATLTKATIRSIQRRVRSITG